MKNPTSVEEASWRLNELEPDNYFVKLVYGSWHIVNSKEKVVCHTNDNTEITGKLFEFFAASPDTIESLLDTIKDLQRIVIRQQSTINELNEKKSVSYDGKVHRDNDNLRCMLNRTKQSNEQLLGENRYLRGMLKRTVSVNERVVKDNLRLKSKVQSFSGDESCA